MSGNVKCTVEQRRFHENHAAYRWLLFTLLAVETYNLSSQLPTKWIVHTTFQLRGGRSITGLLLPQRNLRRQCQDVRRMLCAVGALLRKERYEKKD